MRSKESILISGVRDDITEAEVAAMNVSIAQNISYTTGGDLKIKNAAQITERIVTEFAVR
ncbi:DUF2922 domain-containing protein [Candidatus Clostridium radicumherbarum]|uniref:DUF2922 domain-containing protein n=1 Tax=Candidatus Clostridium radicumherbarum TaxID=3381662 RepID=A0ABW8TRT9_9CLOT